VWQEDKLMGSKNRNARMDLDDLVGQTAQPRTENPVEVTELQRKVEVLQAQMHETGMTIQRFEGIIVDLRRAAGL